MNYGSSRETNETFNLNIFHLMLNLNTSILQLKMYTYINILNERYVIKGICYFKVSLQIWNKSLSNLL